LESRRQSYEYGHSEGQYIFLLPIENLEFHQEVPSVDNQRIQPYEAVVYVIADAHDEQRPIRLTSLKKVRAASSSLGSSPSSGSR
jgi:hypothetical protein